MPIDEQIGYGKPPGHSRFKKGQSGNPKGRSSGTKNLRTDLNEELQESVLVREGERAMRISKQRAIVKSLVARTLKGDPRAATTLTNMMYRVVDLHEDVLAADEPLGSDDVEILEAFKRRLLASANSVVAAVVPVAAAAGVAAAASAAADGEHDYSGDRNHDDRADSDNRSDGHDPVDRVDRDTVESEDDGNK